MPQENWFKTLIKNPYVRGAVLLWAWNTQYEPKHKSAAEITWHVAAQAQSAIAKSIPDTTKNDTAKRK
jgi:hypothetical protein